MRPIVKPRRVIVLCLSLALVGSFYSMSRSAHAFSTQKSAEESIGTYDSDCKTPKTVFYLGDTVCAKAADFPFFPEFGYRRFQWAAPNGHVADRVDIAADPDANKFVIPTSGDLAQVGNWYASTLNTEANREVRARFIVRDRRQFFADLGITKWKLSDLIPGERIVYRLRVTNPGPDFAEGIEITDEVPEFMVFAGVRQSSGEQIDCATPKAGEKGVSICRGKGLATDEVAELDFYYVVDPNAREGTHFTSNSWISSSTEDLNKFDNFSVTEYVLESEKEEGPVLEEP